MSTILKALKKLEQNGDRPEGLTSRELDARQALQRVLRPKWQGFTPANWLLFGVLLLVIALSVYLYLNHSQAQHQTKRQPQTRRIEIPKDNVAATPSRPQRMTQPAREQPVPIPPRSIDSASAVKRPPAARIEDGSLIPEGEPANRMQPPIQHVERPKQEKAAVSVTIKPPDTGHIQTSPEQIKPTGGAVEQTSEQRPGTGAARLTDGRLKVQAIVWAQVPSERIAVINDNILREGLLIDSFVIVEIKANEVLVREGEQ